MTLKKSLKFVENKFPKIWKFEFYGLIFVYQFETDELFKKAATRRWKDRSVIIYH